MFDRTTQIMPITSSYNSQSVQQDGLSPLHAPQIFDKPPFATGLHRRTLHPILNMEQRVYYRPHDRTHKGVVPHYSAYARTGRGRGWGKAEY